MLYLFVPLLVSFFAVLVGFLAVASILHLLDATPDAGFWLWIISSALIAVAVLLVVVASAGYAALWPRVLAEFA